MGDKHCFMEQFYCSSKSKSSEKEIKNVYVCMWKLSICTESHIYGIFLLPFTRVFASWNRDFEKLSLLTTTKVSSKKMQRHMEKHALLWCGSSTLELNQGFVLNLVSYRDIIFSNNATYVESTVLFILEQWFSTGVPRHTKLPAYFN